MLVKSATLVLLALAGSAAVVLGQQRADFVIRLPREVNPERVMIATWGYGATSGELDTKMGVFDYPLEVQGADDLKILIYCPGYKMVAAEFKKDALRARQIFVPTLEKLPTTPLEVRLVDSKQQPLSNQTLHLTYHLTEAMNFFGYVDGIVPILRLGTLKTDANGAVRMALPSFAEDPFFQRQKQEPLLIPNIANSPFFQDCRKFFQECLSGRGQFEISNDSAWRGSDDRLRPRYIPTQKIYTQPLIVTKTLRGILSGQLGAAFLGSHGLKGDLTPYIKSVNSGPLSARLDVTAFNGQMNYNAKLRSDGTFEVELAPGEYDLNLLVFGPGFTLKEKITVQSGVVIEESKRKVITRNE